MDGIPIEGTFRAHRVPLATVRETPEHLRVLEAWLRSSRPEDLVDDRGRLVAERGAQVQRAERRMGANPHVNGGHVLTALDLPDVTGHAPNPIDTG